MHRGIVHCLQLVRSHALSTRKKALLVRSHRFACSHSAASFQTPTHQHDHALTDSSNCCAAIRLASDCSPALFACCTACVRPRRIDERRHGRAVRRPDAGFVRLPSAAERQRTAHGGASPRDDRVAAVDVEAARHHRQDHPRRPSGRTGRQLHLPRSAGRVRTRLGPQDDPDRAGARLVEFPRSLGISPPRRHETQAF